MFEYHWTWRGTCLTTAGLRSLWLCRHGREVVETAGTAPPGDDKRCCKTAPVRYDWGAWTSFDEDDGYR